VELESALGVDKGLFYHDFADRVRARRGSLANLLVSERAKGKRIACYGAAVKGATMVNYLDLGPVGVSQSDIRIAWWRTSRIMSCCLLGILRER
jgi:hypothetical protein